MRRRLWTALILDSQLSRAALSYGTTGCYRVPSFFPSLTQKVVDENRRSQKPPAVWTCARTFGKRATLQSARRWFHAFSGDRALAFWIRADRAGSALPYWVQSRLNHMFQVSPAVLRNVFWPGVGKREGCWILLILLRQGYGGQVGDPPWGLGAFL